VNLRRASASDTEALVELRMRMFEETALEVGTAPEQGLERATRDYFAQEPAKRLCESWVVEVEGTLVAAGTIALFRRPPYPGNLAGHEAYLFNMYTVPEHRRKGYARAIFESLMAFAREQGYGKVWLHSTHAGRQLYESSGFRSADTYLEWVPATLRAPDA